MPIETRVISVLLGSFLLLFKVRFKSKDCIDVLTVTLPQNNNQMFLSEQILLADRQLFPIILHLISATISPLGKPYYSKIVYCWAISTSVLLFP